MTLPRDCFRKGVVSVPIGHRKVLIVSDPQLVKRILVEDRAFYPKSDLMISALSPLVGEGVLVSNGDQWTHDRLMLDPAFAHMRIEQMFPQMRAALDAQIQRFDALLSGHVIDLEAELSHVTADIMLRTLFSRPIDGADMERVFQAFTRFQRNAPQFDLKVILRSDPAHPEPLSDELLNDARLIRGLMGDCLDARYAQLAQGQRFLDFAQAAIEARDEQGQAFSREQLIDQLSVFFLAGHETTASALAWTFFLLSQVPLAMARLRDEIDQVLGQAPFQFSDTKRLVFSRAVFRESLRLYPPVAFLTRRALRPDRFASFKVPVDSFIVISPWIIHRHERYWSRAHEFDPDRFAESAPPPVTGSYLPFGFGPRVCTGATIAYLEAALILTELARRYDFEPVSPEAVFPISRVTIRPEQGIACRVIRRLHAPQD